MRSARDASPRRTRLRGCIASAGFESGDRFVVGWWHVGPFGPFRDVMWARPNGHRHLIASSPRAADFITSIYRFDAVEVATVTGMLTTDRLDLSAGPLDLAFRGGRWLPVAPPRPLWVTERVEAPIASRLLGVTTVGVSPTGVTEWYQAHSVRFLSSARATKDGVDCGAMGPLLPACGFGFSEPPPRPSMVRVRPLLAAPHDHPMWAAAGSISRSNRDPGDTDPTP